MKYLVLYWNDDIDIPMSDGSWAVHWWGTNKRAALREYKKACGYYRTVELHTVVRLAEQIDWNS